MKEEVLLNKYSDIEEKLEPVRTFLQSNWGKKEYESLYKGFLPLLGPIKYNPEILFLGYNPGDGAYAEAVLKGQKIPPVRMLRRKNNAFVQAKLDWYKEGVAYGEFLNSKEKKGWKSYEWYQIDKPINNVFPARMLRLLNEVAKIGNPDESYDELCLPPWYDSLGQSVVYYNLYPIATTNIADLNKIHTCLSRENGLMKIWNESKGKEKRISSWVVRKYFIEIVKNLVDLTRPKVIVCLGLNTFNDFCNTKRSKKDSLIKEKVIRDTSYTVLGLNRSGNWSGRIPLLAKQIVTNQNHSNK